MPAHFVAVAPVVAAAVAPHADGVPAVAAHADALPTVAPPADAPPADAPPADAYPVSLNRTTHPTAAPLLPPSAAPGDAVLMPPPEPHLSLRIRLPEERGEETRRELSRAKNKKLGVAAPVTVEMVSPPVDSPLESPLEPLESIARLAKGVAGWAALIMVMMSLLWILLILGIIIADAVLKDVEDVSSGDVGFTALSDFQEDILNPPPPPPPPPPPHTHTHTHALTPFFSESTS